MTFADDMLRLLQCPITGLRLVNARPEILERANSMIDERQLTNRLGEVVEDFFDGGLIDNAGTWLYAVHDGIVCLLADEAIPLAQLDIKQENATR
jgi:uncharacterized protein YbaR (Trm112 family)